MVTRRKLAGAWMLGLVCGLGVGVVSPSAAADPAQALIEEAVKDRAEGRNLEALYSLFEALEVVWADIPLTLDFYTLVAEPPRGFASYTPRPDNAFAADEAIRVYLEPVGYGFREVGPEALEVHLSADYLLIDGEGRILAGQRGFGDFVFEIDQPAFELYVSLDFRFRGAPAGDYLLQGELVDMVTGDRAPFDIPFIIVE